MVDFTVCIRVIRVIRSLDHPLFSFVIMSLCLKKIICLHPSLCYSVSKKSSVSICHYVILSQKNHLSPSVPLLFCLKKIICLHLSLCHSVSKKSFVSICHCVILSQKNHLSPFIIMSFCLKKIICLHLSLCHSVFKKNICLHLSLCHSVSKKSSVSIRPSVILSQKFPLSSSVPLLLCLSFILSVSR